jgi:hypothetical protein
MRVITSAAMALSAGMRIGPYVIRAPIGAGGMGRFTVLTTRGLIETLPSKSPRSVSVEKRARLLR